MPITEDSRIDWFRMFDDLKRAGWDMSRIALKVGIARTTLLGWKLGAEPRHADGEVFINFWIEVMQMARENLPIERRFPTAYHRK